MKSPSIQPMPAARDAAPAMKPSGETGRPRPGRNGSRAQHRSAPRGLDRSFAEIPAVQIADEDGERAEATRVLLQVLASALGMRLDRIDVRVDGDAANIVARRGASGVMERGIVYLDPAEYDPTSRRGTRLLAHEVAHAAQRLLPAPEALRRAGLPVEAVQAAAEMEAQAVAETFLATRTAPPVRIPLAPDAVACFADPDTEFLALAKTAASSRKDEIAELTRLLSTSFLSFDWAITDGDVEDALRLLGTVPMLTAAAIARNLTPKCRRDLIDNLNPCHYPNHRTEILAVGFAAENPAEEWKGLEDKLLNPLTLDDLSEIEAVAVSKIYQSSKGVRSAIAQDPKQAARVADIIDFAARPETSQLLARSLADEQMEEEQVDAARKETDPAFAELADRIRSKLDEFIVTDEEALALLDAIAADCLKTREPANDIRRLVNALTEKYLDKLIDQIPVKGIYKSEKRRKAVTYLVGARPPFKNAKIAGDLLSGFGVSSQDAFLAFLLVKSMPEQARSSFFKSYQGEKWSKIFSELPVNIRESETLNLYTGGKEDKDRQSILGQLVDDTIWSPAAKDRLRAVIRMARAAGEGEFVFDQSRIRKADEIEGLEDVVKEFALFQTGFRNTYREEPLEGHDWTHEGIASTLGTVGQAIDFIFSSENVDIDTKAIGGEGLNLYELQDVMGGDVLGARFSETKLSAHKAAKKQGKEAKNFADARWDTKNGRLDLTAPQLELVKLAYPYEDMRFTGGPATLSDVKFSMRYVPERQLLRSLEVAVGDFNIASALLTMSKSLVSINRIHVKGLKIVIEASDKSNLDKTVPGPEGCLRALGNMWRLLTGSASANMSAAIAKPGWAKTFLVTFQSLDLEGLATSGGSFIQKVEIGNFVMQAGGDAAAYKAALVQSERRLGQRIDEENAKASNLAATDAKASGRHQSAKARLERQRDKVLKEINANRPAGSTLDIGGVKITGVAGVTDKEPLELSDIHGQGSSVTNLVPLLTDSTALRNIIMGEQGVPAVKGQSAADDDFTIDVGDIDTSLRLVGDVPTAQKAKQELDDFVRKCVKLTNKPGYNEVKTALEMRAQKAERYALLAGKGIQNLRSEKQADELAEFRELKQWLVAFEQKRATVIERLSIQGGALTVGPRGQLDLQADILMAQNIRTLKEFADWESQLAVKRLTVERLNISVTGLGNILADDFDFDRDAADLSITGRGKDGNWFERAEIEGVSKGTGPADRAGADKLVLGPMAAGLKRTKHGWKLEGCRIGSLQTSRLSYASDTTKISTTGATSLTTIGLDAEIVKGEEATKLVVEKLSIASIVSDGLAFENKSAKVTVDSGELQDVLVQGMTITLPEDPAQDTGVEGTISADKIKSLALTAVAGGYDVEAKVHSAAKALTVRLGKSGLEEIDLGNLSGSADVAKPGTKNKIHVEWKLLSAEVSLGKTKDGKGDIVNIKNLKLGSLGVRKDSRWEGEKAVINIHDAARLNNLSVSARVRIEEDKEGKKKLTDAVIHTLTVDEIVADDVEILVKGSGPKKQEAKNKKMEAEPEQAKRFRLDHGSIHGLKMTGFDLLNRTGKIEVLRDFEIQKLQVEIGEEAKGAVQKGTISFKLHGKQSPDAKMAGRELSAELRKDGKTIHTGTLESFTGEDIHGDTGDIAGGFTSRKIATGRMTSGPIEITSNKITVSDIEIASIDVTAPVYRDDRGTVLQLTGGAKITGIHLPYLEAEFGDVSDGKGGTKEGLKRIKLGGKGAGADMLIDRIEGHGLIYRGVGKPESGKKGKATIDVTAKDAVITAFHAVNIERDFVKKLTRFDGGLKRAELKNFVFKLEDAIGNTTRLAADVDAKELRADLMLTDTVAGGKPWVSGLSTFELDELGLTKIDYHQMKDGKITTLYSPGDNSAEAKLKGLKAKLTPEGGAFLSFDQLAAHNMRLNIAGTTIDLRTAELYDFALGLKGAQLEAGKRDMAAKLKTFKFEGLAVNIVVERKTPEKKTEEKKTEAEKNQEKEDAKWILAPLAGLEGNVTVAVEDNDYHITAPIHHGVLDFDDDAFSGPAYLPMGAENRGIYVDKGILGGRDIKYGPPGNAGITPETVAEGARGGRIITSRGSVNLRTMLEAVMNQPAAATPQVPERLDFLDSMGVQAPHLKLGDGRIGTGKDWIELESKSGEDNVFSVKSAQLGDRLRLDMPMFRARKGHFTVAGKEATTGAIEVETLSVVVSELSAASKGTAAKPVFRFTVTIRADKGFIEDIKWGNVQIFNPGMTGLAGEPEPKKKGAATK